MEIAVLEGCELMQSRPRGTEGSPEEFVVVRVKRDREWFARCLPDREAAWKRILKGREEGLCEIVEEPVRRIVCEIE